MCDLIATELAERGYEAACETDPERALASLRARAFDAVVTDLRMVGMSGVELL